MKLSLSSQMALTFGSALLIGAIILHLIFVPRPSSFAQHARGMGLSLLVERLASLPPSNRPAELERLRPQLQTEVRIEPRSSAPPFEGNHGIEVHSFSITLIEALDDQEVLIVGPISPPRPAPTFFITLAFVFMIVLCIGVWGVRRPVARRLLQLQRRIIAMGGSVYEPSHERLDEFEQTDLILTWASAVIEARSEERRAFLQALTHEIRTPLSRIQFELERFERKPDEQARMLAAMHQELGVLVQLAAELRNWTEVAASAEAHAPFELVQALGLAVELEHDRCQRQDIKLELCLPDRIDWLGQRRQLDRAFENLLRNAFAHASGHIRVTARDTGSGLTLSFEDDGPGVPEKAQESIFNPFVGMAQGEDAPAGLGLGLAIVRRVVDHHQGTITVGTSEDLGGACFEVWLPKHTSPD